MLLDAILEWIKIAIRNKYILFLLIKVGNPKVTAISDVLLPSVSHSPTTRLLYLTNVDALLMKLTYFTSRNRF